MKEQEQNNRNSEIEDNAALDRMLDACRFQPVDTTRIKNLVHEKIRNQETVRKRRLRHIFAGTLSAAACVALIVVFGLSYFSSSAPDLSSASMRQLARAGYKELIVPAGQRQEIILPDGSRLIANSRSRVRYPEKFEGKERRIYANGEVFLEVAKDRNHPFVVESAGFDVRVLGTVFNICNSSDSTASVVLVEGSVEIDMENNRSIRLKPNDKAELLNGDVTSLTQVDPENYTSWTDGLLYLKGMPLSQLTRTLSDHYGIEIKCQGSLAGVKVYGKLDLHDNVDTVINSIREIVPMRITRSGNSIMLKP